MRFRYLLLVVLVFAAFQQVDAQDKHKKKVNKDWMKLKSHQLPPISVVAGLGTGFLLPISDEFNVDFVPKLISLNPQLIFNVAGSDHFGLQFGFQYRTATLRYSAIGVMTDGTLINDVNINVQQKISNLGVVIGGFYLTNLAKRGGNCQGFSLFKGTGVDFFTEFGVVVAPTISHVVKMRGNVKTTNSQGDLVSKFSSNRFEEVENSSSILKPMIVAYIKPGFRFQNPGSALRIGPMVEYQIGTIDRFVNNYTNKKMSYILYGVHFSYEFF